VIGMESCGGAHHWARKLQENGFVATPTIAQDKAGTLKQQIVGTWTLTSII